MSGRPRSVSMDLIRSLALFSVIGVHFFLNTGYYSQAVHGTQMFVMTWVRSFFMICVPLFILLSGFLMCNKKLNRQYYKGIIKTLCVYVLASIVCFLYDCIAQNKEWSLEELFFSILNYKAAPYAWYVEMYIGLFLMIPFLNICYHGINTQKQKRILLYTAVAVSSLPAVVNIENSYLPAFWTSLYPICYYFIGCYMHEYGCKVKKYLLWILLLCSTLSLTLASYYYSYDGKFIWGSWQKWQSFYVLVQAVAVFLLLKDVSFVKDNKRTRFTAKVLRKISDLTFGAYLVSYMFDAIFYSWLCEHERVVLDRFVYILVLVPVIFICSLLLSWVLHVIYTQLYGLCARFCGLIRNHKKPKKEV